MNSLKIWIILYCRICIYNISYISYKKNKIFFLQELNSEILKKNKYMRREKENFDMILIKASFSY